MTTPTGFISRKKAREFAGGISRSTEYRWRSEGQFPTLVQIGPNTYAYRQSDLEVWAASKVEGAQ